MPGDPIAALVKLLPRTWQPLVVISGAILVHITLGTIYTFGNMSPYIISYQKNNVSMAYSESQYTWLLTAQGSLQPVAGILGGFLERHIGPRFTVHVGGLIMCAGVFASRWAISNSFGALLVTYGIMFGTGMGIAYNAAIVCAMKVLAITCLVAYTYVSRLVFQEHLEQWLPKHRGLASGLVLVGFGCGAFVFNPVQTHYINPWDYKPLCVLNDGKKYFCQSDLLARVPNIFLIMAASFATMQLLGSLVLFNPDPAEDEQDLVRPEAASIPPKEVLRSSTFYMLGFTFFCNSQTTFFITALYKRFGEAHASLNDDTFLAWVGSASSIFNALGRPLWGFLGDRFSYQLAMCSLTTSMAVFMLTLQVTPVLGRAAFLIWVCAIYLSLCGNFPLFPAVTAKAFGQKYMGMNYGIVMSFTSVGGIISSLLAEILISKISYTGMFLTAAGFSVISFIITVFIQKSKHGRGIAALKESSIDNPNYNEDHDINENDKNEPIA